MNIKRTFNSVGLHEKMPPENTIPTELEPEILERYYKETGYSVLHIVNDGASIQNYDRYGSYPYNDMEKKELSTGKYAEDPDLSPLNDYNIVIEDDIL